MGHFTSINKTKKLGYYQFFFGDQESNNRVDYNYLLMMINKSNCLQVAKTIVAIDFIGYLDASEIFEQRTEFKTFI